MKRMIAFIFLIFTLLGLVFVKFDSEIDIDYESVVVVSNYDNLIDCERIKNGNEFYYNVNKDCGKQILKNIDKSKVKGMIFYISNDYDLKFFQKKFDCYISNVSVIEEREIYYGYDKDYNDYKLINGKKINFQLANDGNQWILGYPMIITGF